MTQPQEVARVRNLYDVQVTQPQEVARAPTQPQEVARVRICYGMLGDAAPNGGTRPVIANQGVRPVEEAHLQAKPKQPPSNGSTWADSHSGLVGGTGLYFLGTCLRDF